MPALPTIDADDRRIIGMGLVLMTAFLVLVLFVAFVVGAGVRVFTLAAGW